MTKIEQIKITMKKLYYAASTLLIAGFGLSLDVNAQNGGEICTSATIIPSIPYSANGMTTGMTDDYNTVCPAASNGGGGKDVVYEYTTGGLTEYININLCTGTTNFDAQVYVYMSSCTGTPIGCSEDACNNSPVYNQNYIPKIDNLALSASTTYYIVVDGYNTGASGDFTISITAGSAPVGAQIQFTDMTSLLPTSTFHSGNAVGVADMNGDGLDDIIRASDNSVMYIDYQTAGGGNFTEASFANNIGDPWGMCVGDVNNDGMNDVLWGDNGAARMLVWNGTDYTGTNISAATGAGYLFTQGANMFDINNDGFLDAFVCHDIGMSHVYMNNTSGGWTYDMIQTQLTLPLATSPSSDNSGNYASIWTDANNDNKVDLYITHCRQAVSNSTDPRRINQLFLNDGSNNFVQDVTDASNLRIGAQSWSTDFGDLDNDGDMDAFVLNYDVESQLLTNDGSGVFTDIIATSGISGTNTFFGMNVVFEDFDNDTYLDILITGDDEHRLYINNGDLTFTLDGNDFIYNNYIILSQGTGDLNHDGHIDIYASYAGVYNNASSTRSDKVWMNDGVDGNKFITFQCTGTTSNINGVGAIIKIYGPWGVQIREVRSGEAYGIQNTFDAHFGLGQNTSVDSTYIYWPSGNVDVYYDLTPDQFIPVTEGGSPLAINENESKPEISVYPNPVNDIATFNVKNTKGFNQNELSLEIRDITGKLVFVKNDVTVGFFTVDGSVLSAGAYTYTLKGRGEILTNGKLIKN